MAKHAQGRGGEENRGAQRLSNSESATPPHPQPGDPRTSLNARHKNRHPCPPLLVSWGWGRGWQLHTPHPDKFRRDPNSRYWLTSQKILKPHSYSGSARTARCSPTTIPRIPHQNKGYGPSPSGTEVALNTRRTGLHFPESSAKVVKL